MSALVSSLLDLFRCRLSAALEMEHDSLRMLEELGATAVDEELRHAFLAHAEETRNQILHLNEAFLLLELQPTEKTSPTTKGMAKEAEAMLHRTDRRLHDEVAIASALGAEHYEIATYRSLVIAAQALGLAGVAELLRVNLVQEEEAADELDAADRRTAMAAGAAH